MTAAQNERSLFTSNLEADVVPTCQGLGIGVGAFSPLARGLSSDRILRLDQLTRCDDRRTSPRFTAQNFGRNIRLVAALREFTMRRGATVCQGALAWMLHRGGDIVPIPGAEQRGQLEENVRTLDIELSQDELTQLEQLGSADPVAGYRLDDQPAGTFDLRQDGWDAGDATAVAGIGQTSKHIVAIGNNWLALAVLLAGAFMALLDTTIVNVAVPTIRASLGASNATLSWIVSGYVLAFGLALIPAGRIGDRIGHKWVFIGGLSLFTLASLACGLAHDDAQLIAARAVQGLAGGMYFAPITALIQLMFVDRQRARAFSIRGATIGFSIAFGPLAGGLLIETFGAGAGWRLVFGVNIPIGVLVVAAGLVLLPTRTENRGIGVDWLGLGVLSAGLAALLTALIEGQQLGWPVWTYLSMAAGAATIVLFGLWERRVENLGGNPLVPPRLFRHRSFAGGLLLGLVAFAAFTSIFFTIAMLWQAGLGHNALQSGLVVMPFAAGIIVGAARSGTFAARFGRLALVVALGLVAGGLSAVWLVLAVNRATSYSGWQLVVPLLVAGVGFGVFIAANLDFIVATVDPADAGAASGVIGATQRVGSAIGVAVTSTVLFGTLHFNRLPNSVALAFGHSAALAMAVSAALSIAAFGLAFALPATTRPGN